MPRRLSLITRSLALAALMAAPAAICLAVLASMGALAPGAAWGAAVVIFLALIAPSALHVRHLTRLAERIRNGAADMEPASLVAPELDEAAARAVQRHRAELDALRAALDDAERLLASLPDPLIMLDRDQRILKANPAADSLLQQRLSGRELAAVLRHPALLDAVDAAMTERRGASIGFSIAFPVERQISAVIEPLRRVLPDGTAAVLVLHDVTQLTRADRMRADFIANASHELRTPLSTLLGFLETLEGPARDDAEARTRFLPIMLAEARRMTRLVTDLLSLSRIEMHEHTPPTQRVDLAALLAGLAEAMQMKAAERQIAIRLEAGPLPQVTGDADELAQVFQNLIDNALKYSRPRSEVTIAAATLPPKSSLRGSSRLAEGAVAVSVIDRGEGIAREHLPRLTERFYRIDSARSRALGGTGLGLAIVKHIVSRHRGELEIESRPGEGSSFTVVLPAAPPDAGSA